MTNTIPQLEEPSKTNHVFQFDAKENIQLQINLCDKIIGSCKNNETNSDILLKLKAYLSEELLNTKPGQTVPNAYLDLDIESAKNFIAYKKIDAYFMGKMTEDPNNRFSYAEIRKLFDDELIKDTFNRQDILEVKGETNQATPEVTTEHPIQEVNQSSSQAVQEVVSAVNSKQVNIAPEEKFKKKPSVILNKANSFGSTIAAVTPYLATACVAVPMVIGSAAVALSNVPFFATVGVSAYMLKTLNNKYKQSPPGSAEYENKSKFSKFMLNGAHTLTTALGLGVGGAAVAACSLTALAYAPALIASVTGLFAANSILATGAVNALTVGAGIYGVKKVINHISEDGKGHGNQSQILQKLAAIRDKALGSEDTLSPKLPKLG